MPNPTPKIVVAGDVSIDWMAFSVAARDTEPVNGRMPFNWQLQTGTRMVARPGGALLLAEMTGLATGAEIITHRLAGLENIPSSEVIHSIAELDRFPYSSDRKDEKNLVYRVKRLCGFAGPDAEVAKPLPVHDDDPDAQIVILDDAGNGFRDEKAVWPAALNTKDHQPIVIFKTSRPLFQGKLWDTVRKAHTERLVVVVRADDLRADGVNISRRLSWEQTAADFVWQMTCNSRLISLANCVHLVVTFGLDGAIHYARHDDRIEARLYYDPTMIEDGFRDDCPGEMLGLTSAFVASLAARIAEGGLAAVGEGVRDGLGCARRFFRQGYGTDPAKAQLKAGLFHSTAGQQTYIADVEITRPEPLPNSAQAKSPSDPKFWRILEGLKGLEEIACEFVRAGQAADLKNVPVGQFGKLKTVDRAEIESFRSIRNLMREYLYKTDATRPLSIAVFGPPGSGKSFGVTEVAESLAPGRVQRQEFNLAQFSSIADLTSALHKVRDIALSGKVPLIFLDEFDADFNGKLGWLKYFLAPMQDGAFKDGETMHPLGKAIFVFAGGTSETYQKFCAEENSTGSDLLSQSADKRLAYAEENSTGSGSDLLSQSADQRLTDLPAHSKTEFKAAKGPDFVSRLRGYVNILGLNPVNERDNFWVIRRALLLRSLLERKAKWLFDGSGRAGIDEGVLRALLKVPRYKHGARSMEAIIEMSLLAGRKNFEQAALPPAEQLALHVDADWFSRLVIRDVLLGSAREIIAKAIHEKYRRNQQDKKVTDDPAMQPWEKLGEDFKESNRQQADQIPEKLRSIKCDFSQVTDRQPVEFEFTKEEVESLAEIEHDRWMAERQLAGWRYGAVRDDKRKTSPYLIPWSDLADDVKQWDRDTVLGMPKFLAEAGFEIYRLI